MTPDAYGKTIYGGGTTGARSATRLEFLVALAIVVFPVMGTFFAPETYFAPQDYSEAATFTGFPFARIFAMMVILWLAFLFVKMPVLFLRALQHATLPLIFVLWTMVTAFWSGDPAASLNRSFRLLSVMIFAAYLMERFDKRELLRLVLYAGLIAIFSSIVAVVALPQYGRVTLIGYEGAWRGATIHKNFLGYIMSTIFAFSYAGLKARLVDRQLGLVILFLSFCLVVMSRSTTSLILAFSMAVLIEYFTIILRLPTRKAKFGGLMMGMFALSGIYLAYLNADVVLTLLGKDPTFTGRTDVWDVAIDLIMQKPILGWGAGFWSIDTIDREYAYRALMWAAPHAHNNILDVWLQLGIPGLVIYATLVISVLARGIVMLFRRSSGPLDVLWPSMVIVILIAGLSETNTVAESSPALFWMTIAYLALGSLARQARRTAHRPVRPVIRIVHPL